MSNFLVSSLTLLQAPRSGVYRAQKDLQTAQKEVTTGRYADVGLALGVRTSQAVSLRNQKSEVDLLRQGNAILSQRFELMQNSLNSLADTAEGMQNSLISNGTSNIGLDASITQANSALQQLMDAVNVSSGSRFLFGGVNAENPPISFKDGLGATLTGYDGSTAQADTATAFQDAFGFAQDSASVASISADDLKTFLDGDFDKLFALTSGATTNSAQSLAGWANWSKANGAPVYNLINGNQSINVSYGADSEAFRNIAKGYAMLTDLGAKNMNDEARQLLTSRAIESLSQGVSQLTAIRSSIGTAQTRLDDTDALLKSRSNILNTAITDAEGVDPYEASTRVTNLTNLLESSYALTARISRLSILNYL